MKTGLRRRIQILIVVLAVLSVCLKAGAEEEQRPFSMEKYATILSTYVDNQGMVNYKAMKANRSTLDEFIGTLGRVDPKIYEKWTKTEKIAFWINAYNALTLKAIIDHYPIKASGILALAYPRNSIRQISGVWDKLEFEIAGNKMTLDGIEHEVLRKEFSEPRIHVALVCAAMGCPPLRNEPYTGEKLDSQLDDQSKRFLGNSEKFRIDRDKNRVYMSPIFNWFGEDFIPVYAPDTGGGKRGDAAPAVLNFVSRYLPKKDTLFLDTASYKVKYLDYDWTLNEQKEK